MESAGGNPVSIVDLCSDTLGEKFWVQSGRGFFKIVNLTSEINSI